MKKTEKRWGKLYLAIAIMAVGLFFSGGARADVDTTGPTLTAFSATPTPINTSSSPQTITATFTVTDPSGVNIENSDCELRSKDANQSKYGKITNTDGNQYTCEFTLPVLSAKGQWTFNLNFGDNLNNWSCYDSNVINGNEANSSWPSDATGTIINNTASIEDVAPPTLTAFSATPTTVNTESENQTVTATITATDVIGVQLDPGGDGSICQLINDNDNYVRSQPGVFVSAGGDRYTCAVVLPTGSATGNWHFRLALYDNFGQNIYYETAAEILAKVPGATGTAIVNGTVSAPIITSVAVKTPPTKTTYVVGENLDLSGLVVTLSKSDGSTQDVAFTDFSANDITTGKANGAALSAGETSIAIMAGNHMINQAITVNSAPLLTATIAGIAAPLTGAIPTSSISETDQCTATIYWDGNPTVFMPNTSYTAIITITPKVGHTLSGVSENFFTVAGATTANTAGSGVVTAVFPETLSSNPFISKWDTTKVSDGSSNDNQIKLPLKYGGTYNFAVDWGDGTNSRITSYDQADVTHTYANPGIYTVTIGGIIKGISFPMSSSENVDNSKIIEISQWGNLGLGNDALGCFYGTSNLNITASDILDLSGTSIMSYAFSNSGISTVPNIDKWDLSNVTDMHDMFNGAKSFNQPIGSWDVSKVTSMSDMFDGATSFNQPIGNWNVSHVTKMYIMFEGATSFNQPIGNWNVANVIEMSSMFSGATSFNQPIGNWDVSNVTNMSSMFSGATSFNQPIGNWDVSRVSNMANMFSNAKSFNQPIDNWNVSNVTNMSSMFSGATSFNQPIGNWDVSNVTRMDDMFSNAYSFEQLLGDWDVSKVTDMRGMFAIPLDGFSTANYDNLLIGWSKLSSLQQNVNLAANSKYDSGAAADARQLLIDKYHWIITDGGIVEEYSSNNWGSYQPKPLTCSQINNGWDSSKRDLVVIVHGWNGHASDSWVVDMKNHISSNVNTGITAVEAFDWSEDAHTDDPTDPWQAWSKAHDQGKSLAQQILALQPMPKNIHLIAHSAGSEAIQTAEYEIAKHYNFSQHGSDAPNIHFTFLDAFSPAGSSPEYGNLNGLDGYAEQYVDTRLVGTDASLDGTRAQLQNAINFDVTKLDAWKGDSFPSNPVDNWKHYHNWPITIYDQSIGDPLSTLGFSFSQENYTNNVRTPEKLNGKWCTVSDVHSSPYVSCSDSKTIAHVSFGDEVLSTFGTEAISLGHGLCDLAHGGCAVLADIYNAEITGITQGATGTVELLNFAGASVLHLFTGSPSWTKFDFTVKEPVNMIEFDSRFPSQAGEGALAVFVDGTNVFSARTSVADNGQVEHQQFMLPETLTEGPHSIIFRIDPLTEEHSEVFISNFRLGMQTVTEVEVPADTVAPITLLASLGDGGPDWFRSDVQVTLSATDNDGGSEVDKTEYSLDGGTTWLTYSDSFTVSGDGTHEVKFRSTDKAGNVETDQGVTIKIDKATPEITLNAPVDGASYTVKSTKNADWSATDGLSGMDTAKGTIASGNPVDTSSVGSKEFTVTATDLAGNSATKTIKYKVVAYTFGGFQSPTVKDSKTFNSNSTIPVTFQLTDASGKYISGATASLMIDDTIKAVASGGSNNGNSFKYDASSNQYIFNLSVKNTLLKAGTHKLTIMVDDGTTYGLPITIK